jgi:hypothetical protein
MIFDNDTIEDIMSDEHEDFVSVGEKTMVSQSRWKTTFSQVYSQKSNGKYFQVSWSQGSTEMQEGDMYWYLNEVAPVEVTVTKFNHVKNGIKFEGYL